MKIKDIAGYCRNLMEGKKVLDIGCGRKKLTGAIGLDKIYLPGVDIVADLNIRLPFKDEEFECVHADQVLEHVADITGLIYEIHRILKPGGAFIAHCPYFRSSWAHIDPTHLRTFTINSLDYFVIGTFYYRQYRFCEKGFSKIQVYLDKDYKQTVLRKFFRAIAMKNPYKFENTFLSYAYPFEQISYLLVK